MPIKSPVRSSAGPGGRGDLRAHDIGDDVCERGFAQTRRAVEQHVLQRFASLLGGLQSDGELFHNLPLPHVVINAGGTKSAIEALFFLRNQFRRN